MDTSRCDCYGFATGTKKGAAPVRHNPLISLKAEGRIRTGDLLITNRESTLDYYSTCFDLSQAYK